MRINPANDNRQLTARLANLPRLILPEGARPPGALARWSPDHAVLVVQARTGATLAFLPAPLAASILNFE